MSTYEFRGQHRYRPQRWAQDGFAGRLPRTIYFAKSLKALFKTSPAHAADPTKYCRLPNGWYAKLVLSEKQKVDLLYKFGTVAGLLMGHQWDWNGRAAASPQLSAEELLRQLEGAA